MSIIDEETIEEHSKMKFKDSLGYTFEASEEHKTNIVLLELVKQLQIQNELLNDIQVNIKEVSLNLESIKEELK